MIFESDQDYLLSKEDRTQRQMKAMAVWCNMILRSQYEHEELDIGSTMNALQTTLLRLFLSFHPAWLHLGLETIFQTEIKVGDGEPFAQVISRFIVKNLFSDSKIMKNKKFAYGGGKPIITDAGREALHSHFLLYTSLFCYFVESAKAAAIIKHNPGMFSKRSTFKCMEDVFSELSREVLSGSGTPLNKAFAKIVCISSTLFSLQTFLDDYPYSVREFGDLTDGVILGKTIELVTECPPGSVINRLRDPRGDRLRKIGNVKICLHAASDRGLDVQAVKPEALVSGNSDAILEVLWKLVGIYICTKEDPTLRRAPLTFPKFYGEKFAPISGKVTSEGLVLQLWREIGHELGIKVDSLSDLRDGMVFAGAWRMYNANAPDIRLYPGDSLLLKVANAAESNLDVPWGLHYCIGLFAHIYLSRLCSIRELHNAALRIQRAYRSYKLFKAIRLWKLRRAAVDVHDIGNQIQKDTFILAPRVERSSIFETPKPLVAVHDDPDILSASLRNELGEIQHGGHILDLSNVCHTEEVFCTSVNVSLQPNSRAHHTKNCLTPYAEQVGFERAVMLIQRAFRHYCHRKQMREARLREWAMREKAATSIQRAFRYYSHRKQMREARLREWAIREKAATSIQRAFRHYSHRKQMREARLREWAIREKAATSIQRAFRHYSHRKQMREARLRECAIREKAATSIQGAFRHYCHRKQMREERVIEWTVKGKAATNIEDKFSDLRQVLELQYNVRQNERLQKFCSKVLKVCGRKLSEYSESKESITEEQVEPHCCVPSIRDQTTAAIKIQAWFRGYRERARLRVHLQKRRSFMAAYRGNIAAEQPSAIVDNAALSSRPVLAKMHDAVDMLFDSKMYISKVGAFILNRLSALSPHLCAYMVVNAQGLAAILDILEQKTIGRGPPTANILAILQACKHPVVVTEVDAQLEDCIKAALHTFHAFYTDAVIVDGFGRAILALYRRPGAKNYLAKASFYLDYATRRFNRLAQTDPRKAILLRMKEEMSL
ncbi:unnamed protein product [Angiostrongylus costaricensis]|uniref:Calponin-homology (CH) domain-containing protein n=1 Tax=Angiostrongylus costaricensis TaxID=334426 RepID=A0A158PHD0_ANGCS|nr:unnamed protein product [Angiostrongylus costaricensis]